MASAESRYSIITDQGCSSRGGGTSRAAEQHTDAIRAYGGPDITARVAQMNGARGVDNASQRSGAHEGVRIEGPSSAVLRRALAKVCPQG